MPQAQAHFATAGASVVFILKKYFYCGCSCFSLSARVMASRSRADINKNINVKKHDGSSLLLLLLLLLLFLLFDAIAAPKLSPNAIFLPVFVYDANPPLFIVSDIVTCFLCKWLNMNL